MSAVLGYPETDARPRLPSPPFGFVGADSDFRGPLDDMLAGWEEELADLPPGPLEVVSGLRGRRTAFGWVLDGAYTSLQVGLGRTGRPFSAATRHWSADGGPAQWARFPDDPSLDGLGPAVAGAVVVLRYSPLRRCTFRTTGTVVRVERRSSSHDSFRRAAAFSAAATRSGLPVPALGRLYQAASAYTQDDVPGAALAELAAGPDLEPLLAEAGALHAAIHRLDAAGLPPGAGPSAVVAAACVSADWAAAFTAPEVAEELRRGAGRLAASTVAASPPATCHGHRLPRHLIGGPGRWTVTSLDLAHCGDPYRDLATVLAGLPADLPALGHDTAGPTQQRAAEEAYLGGYEERSGHRLDRRRLAWYRAAAELDQLGDMAAGDRWHPAGLGRTVALVHELLEQSA